MTNWVPDLPVVPLHAPPHILDLIEPFRGQGTAVVDGEGSLGYAELDERSAVIATALRAAGVEPDSPVVVHARLSRWAVIGMLGVLRAGARYVPVDAGFPVARQRYIAEASGARFSVSEPGLGIRLDNLRTVQADAEGFRGETVRGTLAYTCFTSGSTGRPKGVTISASALAASTAARLEYYPTPVSTFLLCSSISFDSSVAGIYWTLACGGRLVIPSDRPADLLAVGRAAQEYRASHLLMLPSLYDIALRGGLAERAGALSTVIVAGEACPPDLVQRHFDALPRTRLYNEYGPTECTVWSAVHECTRADADLSDVPIGRAVPGTRLYVRSADGAAVPTGDPGELHIGGPGLAELGSDLYRTGDIVSVTAEAELRFHGRADHQLKLGGMRVDRSEIEQALRTHPDVEAAAVGVCSVQGRKKLVGFVSPTNGEVDQRSLRAHLIERLPAVAVPSRIVPLSRLPVLPNGKLNHGAIDQLAHDALPQKN
jgi:non-ribosomal peptide synthetase component F